MPQRVVRPTMPIDPRLVQQLQTLDHGSLARVPSCEQRVLFDFAAGQRGILILAEVDQAAGDTQLSR